MTPPDPPAATALMWTQLMAGRFAPALATVEQALTHWPDDPELRLNRVTALRHLGRLDEARDAIAPLRRANPDSLNLQLEWAALCQAARNLPAAEAAFADVLRLDPANRPAATALMWTQLMAGRFAPALATVEQALTHWPDDPELRLNRVTALRHLGRLDEARDAIAPLRRASPDSLNLQLEWAALCQAARNLPAAEAAFAEVLRLDPANRPAATALMWTQLMAGRFAPALATVEQALTHWPDDPELRLNRVTALRHLGRLDEAREAIAPLRQASPDSLNLQLEWAALCQAARNLPAAEAAFAEVLRLDPANRPAATALATLNCQRGRAREGLALLDQVLAGPGGAPPEHLAPQDFGLATQALHIAHDLGDRACLLRLLPAMDRALPDLAPDQAQAVAQGHLLLGQASQAAAALTRMLDGRPLDPHLIQSVLHLSCSAQDAGLTARLAARLIARSTHPAMARLQATLLLEGASRALALAHDLMPRRNDPAEVDEIARLLIESGHAEEAARYLRRALRRWPAAAGLAHKYLHALTRCGQAEVGLAWLDSRPNGTQNLPPELFETRIWALIEAGRLPQAHQELTDRPVEQLRGRHLLAKLDLEVALGRTEDARRTAALLHRLGLTSEVGTHPELSREVQMLTELILADRLAGDPGADPVLALRDNVVAARQWLQRHCPAATPAGATGATGTAGRIPARIFQYWDKAPPPTEIADAMASWRTQPGFAHDHLDQAQAQRRIESHLGTEGRRAFRLAANPAEGADYLRLCLLWAEGGVYADADDLRRRDIRPLLARPEGLILLREPIGTIANNFLAAAPGHPVLRLALDLATEALLGQHSDNTWFKTGPGLMTRALAFALAGPDGGTLAADVAILPQRQVAPFITPHLPVAHKRSPQHWTRFGSYLPEGVEAVLQQAAGPPQELAPDPVADPPPGQP